MKTYCKILIKILLILIIPSLLAITAHIYSLNYLQPIIDKAMALHPVVDSKNYGNLIVTLATITSILPTIGTVIVYFALYNHISNYSLFSKIAVLTVTILLIKGHFIRQFIMNIAVGNPIQIALLQELEVWVPNLILCSFIVIGEVLYKQFIKKIVTCENV